MAGFLVLLAAALLGAATALPLEKPKLIELDWWQKTVVYQIYPRSFQDSDDTGTGDLKGIQSRLDYFVNLGVQTVWLSPVYKSPMDDFGYDISDFRDIDPIFGTMDDFNSLVQAIKERGMKLVMDFVPNHSSDQHEWFQRSIQKEDPYTDYYIWLPAKGVNPDGSPIPPNNWVALNKAGSMWEWNEERQEFYLHQFQIGQPDLNYRNPLVMEEMKNVLRFWMELGVDGFRVDAVGHMFEDPNFPDAPPSGNPNAEPGDYDYYDPIYYDNLPETLDGVIQFRQVLDEYSASTDGVTRVMMVETGELKYYGNATNPGAHFPFNFDLLGLRTNFTAQQLNDIVTKWTEGLPEFASPDWLIGNHDVFRVTTRVGTDLVDAMNIVIQLLPGTVVTYYGEELGMVDGNLTWEETVDPSGCNAGPDEYRIYTRDPERTPMEWDQSVNAGFSNASKTWLPVNPDFLSVNVALQNAAAASHLKVYKALVAARKEEGIQQGAIEHRVVADDNVFAFTRIAEGSTGYFVAVNPSWNEVVVDATEFKGVPSKATVYTQNVGFKNPDILIGSVIDTNAVTLGPHDAIVLSFDTTRS